MIHHLTLCKLKPGISSQKVEEMMRLTRMSLLKIDKALSVKCGRNISPEDPWGFFVAVEAETMEKLAAYQEDARYIKYMEEVLKPNTVQRTVLNFETDPARPIPAKKTAAPASVPSSSMKPEAIPESARR